MSVHPDPEMFSNEGPEFSDEQALAEMKKDLSDLGVDVEEIREIAQTLSVDPDGVYAGQVGPTSFTVRRMLNNRFLVRSHPGSESE